MSQKRRTVADRQRTAVRRALEQAAQQLEAVSRPLLGAEAAEIVRALIESYKKQEG